MKIQTRCCAIGAGTQIGVMMNTHMYSSIAKLCVDYAVSKLIFTWVQQTPYRYIANQYLEGIFARNLTIHRFFVYYMACYSK